MNTKEVFKRVYSKIAFNFVPKHSPVNIVDVESFKDFINNSKNIVVITGAGISTESGIPDYRSEDVGLYARSNRKPIQYVEFLKSHKARQRYWARNYVGWDRFSKCLPNKTHYAIRNLEQSFKKVQCVVTQNVDNLHHKAHSQNVIELHGSAYRVLCLNCNHMYDRHHIQDILRISNPCMKDAATIRPDGDVDLPQDEVENFILPTCEHCDGILKPDIVFFGDNVPKIRVDTIKSRITTSDSLLILGTSLSVYSAYRFVLQAVEEQKRILIINIGPTRGDKYADVKISARCSDVLSWLVE